MIMKQSLMTFDVLMKEDLNPDLVLIVDFENSSAALTAIGIRNIKPYLVLTTVGNVKFALNILASFLVTIFGDTVHGIFDFRAF